MDLKRVFVTVGSTTFPELVEAVLSVDVIKSLIGLGAVELCIQHGSNGALYRAAKNKSETALAIRGFDYSPSIEGEMKRADLIISHAGSGSLLEALHLGKSVIAVPNVSLMDNHQIDLASALSDQGYLLKSSPEYA
jgi:beta-1,4-N-acetylglucosaminyltransferase